MSDYREVHEQARAAGVARRNETRLERAMDRAVQTARAEVRRQVAEEIAAKLDGMAADPHGTNGEPACWAFSMAAGIARDIGAKETS